MFEWIRPSTYTNGSRDPYLRQPVKAPCVPYVALGIVLQVGALNAQDAPALAPGARIKVVRPDPGCGVPGAFWCRRWTVVGTLASVDSLTVVVRGEDGTLKDVPKVPGLELDVSQGPGLCSHRRLACIGAGLVGGIGLGTLYGAIWNHEHRANCVAGCRSVYLASVPVGVVLGCLVGSGIGREHWTPTPLPVRLGLGPGGNEGFSVGFSLVF